MVGRHSIATVLATASRAESLAISHARLQVAIWPALRQIKRRADEALFPVPQRALRLRMTSTRTEE